MAKTGHLNVCQKDAESSTAALLSLDLIGWFNYIMPRVLSVCQSLFQSLSICVSARELNPSWNVCRWNNRICSCPPLSRFSSMTLDFMGSHRLALGQSCEGKEEEEGEINQMWNKSSSGKVLHVISGLSLTVSLNAILVSHVKCNSNVRQ